MNTRDIAKICHEANRAYCESLGDDSQPAWDEAPGWQIESAMNEVYAHLHNPDFTPENSHESWLAEKVAAGWVYGKVKDPEIKTHPCCMPYSELPTEQRAKDYLFSAVVRSLAHML